MDTIEEFSPPPLPLPLPNGDNNVAHFVGAETRIHHDEEQQQQEGLNSITTTSLPPATTENSSGENRKLAEFSSKLTAAAAGACGFSAKKFQSGGVGRVGTGFGPGMDFSLCQKLFANEKVYRRWLIVNFKPLFQRHEPLGMPMDTLLKLFTRNFQFLPEHKVARFVTGMDVNCDGDITFDEFFAAMIRMTTDDLSLRERVILSVLVVFNPNLIREERAAQMKQARSHTSQLQAHTASCHASSETSADCSNSAVTSGSPDTAFNLHDIMITRLENEVPDTYMDAYSCRPPPFFILLVSLAQLVMFVVFAIELTGRGGVATATHTGHPSSASSLTWTHGYAWWSRLVFDIRKQHEAWRFVSYCFVHQGYHHIIYNVIVQMIFGIPLEMVHKFWRVSIIYWVGIISGSLAHAIIDPNRILVGSSGGCYALLGAHFGLIIMNWAELKPSVMRRTPDSHPIFSTPTPSTTTTTITSKSNSTKSKSTSIKVPQQQNAAESSTTATRWCSLALSGWSRLVFLSLLIIIDFSVALYRRYGHSLESQTSYAAHLGGFVCGTLISVPTVRNIKKRVCEQYAFWICLALWLCLVVFGFCWTFLYPRGEFHVVSFVVMNNTQT